MYYFGIVCVYVIVNCMYVCNLLWHGRTAMPNAGVKTIKSINQSINQSYHFDCSTRQSYDVKCLVTALATKRHSCCMTVKKSFKATEKIHNIRLEVEYFSGANPGIYRSLRLPLDVSSTWET